MIRDLKVGSKDIFPIRISEILNCKGKNNSMYQRVSFTDESGRHCQALHFGEPFEVQTPAIVRGQIKAESYNGSITYQIDSAEAVTGMSAADFIPKADIEVTEAWNKVVGLINELPNDLKCITSMVIGSVSKEFRVAPGSSNGPFACAYGLIAQTVKLTETAKQLSVINDLDTDIVVAASILYYVGKIDIINLDLTQNPDNAYLDYHQIGGLKVVSTIESIRKNGSDAAKEAIAELTSARRNHLVHIIMNGFDGCVAKTPEALIVRYAAGLVEELEIANLVLKDNIGKGVIENKNAHSLKTIITPPIRKIKEEGEAC